VQLLTYLPCRQLELNGILKAQPALYRSATAQFVFFFAVSVLFHIFPGLLADFV
jgi:hypothetical protein